MAGLYYRGVSMIFPDTETNSQGTTPDQQLYVHRPEQKQLEQPSPLVIDSSAAIEKFPIPCSSGERVNLRQHGQHLQRRKRALLTAETAREVFKLRGRLLESERESGNFCSLFTARSVLVSQVLDATQQD